MAKYSGVPPTGWESSLLQQLGDPDTQANEQFFDDWASTEHAGSLKTWGTNGTGMAFNPFSTTLEEPGATPGNSVGVENYTSWQQGETATVSTLEQANMSPLQTALHSGSATETELEQAESQTPWGQESSWASGTPRFGDPNSTSSGSSTLQNWQNIAPSFNGQTLGTTAPSSSTTPASSTALLTSAPWGGLLGSQIEEAVFFLLGAALVIVGLVITFKSGNEENPVKEAAHGAEIAAA